MFICKVFSSKWGHGAEGRRRKEARASSGLYLLQLRWITKLPPWASHSKRLTNPTTEPVIPDAEIGNWYLLEEREIIWGRGSLLDPTCSLGKTVNSVSLCAIVFALFPIYKMTAKSIKRVMIRLLPGQTQGVAVRPGCTNKCQECLS